MSLSPCNVRQARSILILQTVGNGIESLWVGLKGTGVLLSLKMLLLLKRAVRCTILQTTWMRSSLILTVVFQRVIGQMVGGQALVNRCPQAGR